MNSVLESDPSDPRLPAPKAKPFATEGAVAPELPLT